MKKYFLKNIWYFGILTIAVILSTFSTYNFYSNGNSNLAFTDTSQRLNIARGIFDNLTPDILKFGNLWPPFPQILMVPFVFSDFLWRSGLAGWIISGISYILTSIIIYKIICSLTKKPIYGFIASLTFLININVLYLQSTAMSESFFWLTIAADFYFLYKYLEDKKIKYLILTAITLDISCLTRYEGYALLGGSAVIVFLSCVFNRFKLPKTLGTVFLFFVFGSLGILFWSVYLLASTGQLIFALHYHSISLQTSSVITDALPTYLMSVINMCGLLTGVMGIISFVFVFSSKKISKNIKLLSILPLSLLIAMAYAINKTTPIFQPNMTFWTLLNKNTNLFYQEGVRYGLNFLIYLIIFSLVSISKIKHAVVVYVLLIAVQTIAYFYTPFYLTYQLRESVRFQIPAYVQWFKKNYDYGLIMIYAQKHAPEILKMELPLKTFIYEDTGYYWTTSLTNPSRYAKWIIFSGMSQSDYLTQNFKNKNLKQLGFNQIFNQNGIEIYKKL